jgi:hypothetical protein
MANALSGGSTDAKVAAVKVGKYGRGDGVAGVCNSGNTIHGINTTAFGILASTLPGAVD